MFRGKSVFGKALTFQNGDVFIRGGFEETHHPKTYSGIPPLSLDSYKRN